ncbi:MAG: Uncharacterised protein [Acidimicrobiaceae bacterium]|nr:MAG: Uncharacterised protein [Acidimicrobiaceae bacterium]
MSASLITGTKSPESEATAIPKLTKEGITIFSAGLPTTWPFIIGYFFRERTVAAATIESGVIFEAP